jgi:hypothetical protein
MARCLGLRWRRRSGERWDVEDESQDPLANTKLLVELVLAGVDRGDGRNSFPTLGNGARRLCSRQSSGAEATTVARARLGLVTRTSSRWQHLSLVDEGDETMMVGSRATKR